MKLIIAALSCVLSISAFAEDYYSPDDAIRNCETVARTYANVVMLKDEGLSPIDAFGLLTVRTQDMSKAEKKKTVDLIYFDKSFSGVHFQKNKTEIFFLNLCLGTIK